MQTVIDQLKIDSGSIATVIRGFEFFLLLPLSTESKNAITQDLALAKKRSADIQAVIDASVPLLANGYPNNPAYVGSSAITAEINADISILLGALGNLPQGNPIIGANGGIITTV
jgi:hypothetical protein